MAGVRGGGAICNAVSTTERFCLLCCWVEGSILIKTTKKQNKTNKKGVGGGGGRLIKKTTLIYQHSVKLNTALRYLH